MLRIQPIFADLVPSVYGAQGQVSVTGLVTDVGAGFVFFRSRGRICQQPREGMYYVDDNEFQVHSNRSDPDPLVLGNPAK
jgi:hypothetical protein